MEKRKQLPNTLAKNLRELRQKAGLTQKQMTTELANLGTEITQQSYARYENNNASPDYDTLIKLALILETDVNTLVGFGYNACQYFNTHTNGELVAEKVDDSVVITFKDRFFKDKAFNNNSFKNMSFLMPYEVFEESVKRSKTLTDSFAKEFSKNHFIDGMFGECYCYLHSTNFKTANNSELRGNMGLKLLEIMGNWQMEGDFDNKVKEFGRRYVKESGDK